LTPVANLPPVSLIPVATGVVDTGGNLPPVSLILVANLTPVSTTLGKLVAPVSLLPVANLDLRISPRIFEKN
jgi:hypothetical protein